jgi:hypothetical protein
MAENMVPLPVRVPSQLKEKVASFADENGLSNSEMGRRLLARGLEVERDGLDPERLQKELDEAHSRIELLEEQKERFKLERDRLKRQLEYTPPREKIRDTVLWLFLFAFGLAVISTTGSGASSLRAFADSAMLATLVGSVFVGGIYMIISAVRRTISDERYQRLAFRIQTNPFVRVLFDLPSAEDLEKILELDASDESIKNDDT